MSTRQETFQVGDVIFHHDDDPQARREKYARVVLDSMYQFVGLLDRDGTTLDINASALKGAGVDMSSIYGKPFWQARWFQVSEQTQALQKKFVERARGGEFIRCDMEVYGQAAGEETIVVDFSLLPVKDNEGQVVFLLAEGRNITEKKRIEREMAKRSSNWVAQPKVEQSSPAPFEHSLQKTRRQLAQSDRLHTMGKLMASIAHEINQPLAAIVTNSDACVRWLNAEPANDAEARQALQRIVRDAQRASGVIAKIRGYLSQGEQRAQLLPIHEVITEVLELVGLEARDRMVKVVYEPSPLLPYVRMDRVQIQQVLVNVVINGFEAMLRVDPPRRVLTIRTQLVDETMLQVEVADCGCGVSLDESESLFEAFQSTKNHSMGMGLAICKNIVESHGGQIGFVAHEGVGATLRFTLPVETVGSLL